MFDGGGRRIFNSPGGGGGNWIWVLDFTGDLVGDDGVLFESV